MILLLNIVTSVYLTSMLVIVVWTNIRPIQIIKRNETKVPVWHYYQLQYTNEELGDSELRELDHVYILTLSLINLVLLAVVGI